MPGLYLHLNSLALAGHQRRQHVYYVILSLSASFLKIMVLLMLPADIAVNDNAPAAVRGSVPSQYFQKHRLPVCAPFWSFILPHYQMLISSASQELSAPSPTPCNGTKVSGPLMLSW
jgi:hypothetical protein